MTILFRCDGTAATGLGHVSRCVALAEAFQDLGVEAHFAGAFDEAARHIIGRAGIALTDFRPFDLGEDVAGTRQLIETSAARGIVVDGYQFDGKTFDPVRSAGTRVVYLDDFAAHGRYECDAILNFTIAAPGLKYATTAECVLLGPRFLLARRSLRRARQDRDRDHFQTVCRRLLVCVGGSDRHDLNARLFNAVQSHATPLEIRFVLGAEDLKRAGKWSSSASRHSIEIAGMTPENTANYEWADACVCGGGLVKYEAAYIGLPVAAVSQTAGQHADTQLLVHEGVISDLGYAPETDDALLADRLRDFLSATAPRRERSQRARALFPADPTMDAAQALLAVIREPA